MDAAASEPINAGIAVEVSTNRGSKYTSNPPLLSKTCFDRLLAITSVETWCFINNTQSLGLESDVDGCHLPAKHFMYRLNFLENVKLTALSMDFALTPPTRTFDFELGSNMAPVNYYMSAWMFKDLWYGSSSDPRIRLDPH